MKKVLWASRHQLDPVAKQELEMVHGTNIKCHEILWPSGEGECYDLAVSLLEEYQVVAGVWPGQAVEAFKSAFQMDSGSCFLPERILSPVSVPETEPETKKVRPFRFVRWAVLF